MHTRNNKSEYKLSLLHTFTANNTTTITSSITTTASTSSAAAATAASVTLLRMELTQTAEKCQKCGKPILRHQCVFVEISRADRGICVPSTAAELSCWIVSHSPVCYGWVHTHTHTHTTTHTTRAHERVRVKLFT